MTFSKLSEYFKKLESTPSRLAMTETIADLFRGSTSSEIGKICYLLLGRVVPLYEAIEFGVADKLMIRVIAQACSIDETVILKEFKKMGDLGTAAEAAHGSSHVVHSKKENFSVSDVYDKLYAVATTGGVGSQEKKISLLSDLLKSAPALSARYIVRIPLGKLRLGFSDMTILDGLSWMLAGDKSLRVHLEDAYNVLPDMGFIAEAVKEKGIAGLSRVHAKVGAPILASLCQRIPTADEMIEKMGCVIVEPKYDGERCQIHVSTKGVKTFSRNLENTTAMFPELKHIGKQINAHEVILDSEAIGIDPKTGKFIDFQTTMTRKRKYHVAQARETVPLKFMVFDILYKDGKELLSAPLSERRGILEKTIARGDLLVVSPNIVTSTASAIREYHDQSLKKGLEGVVVKKYDSPYEPGRRGYSWVKFKEEEGKTGKLTDTIDAVIMGFTRGEGKRAAFGIGQFLVGVADGEQFVTLTKVGTGVTDVMWKDLRITLNAIKTKIQPKEYKEVNKLFTPDVWVVPKIVVEIAGDDLTRSPSHGAGYAVRFPRLVKIRSDKSPREATTKKEVEEMYKNETKKNP